MTLHTIKTDPGIAKDCLKMYTAQKLPRIRPNCSSLTSSKATVSSFSWSTLVGNKADALHEGMNTKCNQGINLSAITMVVPTKPNMGTII